jgi:peptide/nickel transport system permease protein
MRFLGLRLLQLVPVVLLVSLGTAALLDLLPGDPAIAILGENATPETIAAVRADLHLDDSFLSRYGTWLGDAVQGDLGSSIRTNRPVTDEFLERLPVTLQLALMAQFFAIVFSVPLGMYAAYRAGKPSDRITSTAAFAFVSLPPFVLAVFLVALFATKWEVFPVTGWERISDDLSENLRHAFLPAITLALAELAVYTQLLRSDMVTTLEEDFVLAARAKGLTTSRILFRHALRPSSFSLITLAGVNLGRLIGGTVVIEFFFSLPGVGQLIVQSIPNKDLPVIQGSVLILATGYLLLNTLVDLSYSVLDPRVRRATA